MATPRYSVYSIDDVCRYSFTPRDQDSPIDMVRVLVHRDRADGQKWYDVISMSARKFDNTALQVGDQFDQILYNRNQRVASLQ